LVLFILLCGLVAFLTAAASAEPNVMVRRLNIDVTVQPDGRYTKIFHMERSATNAAAADRIGQFAIPFNPSLGRLDIIEAYTLKADGTRKNVDVSAIRDQLAPGVPNLPMFFDVQQRVVVFPDVAVGDNEVLTARAEVDRPLLTGQFTWEVEFERFTGWQNVAITITAPRDFPLSAETFELAYERTELDRDVRHAWHYISIGSGTEEQTAVSGWDYRPRFFVSSFPDYAAFAAAYDALAAPKSVVTPDIQAKADEVTTGLTDRREQARALYEWVSAHTRYVALYLGRGAVEPHAAATVLANGYGDCKDHVVLFEALLRAKGIESHAVLINFGNAYTLSAPPTMAQLNHVITWLPEFGMFADTTAAVAPFGTLPYQEYGKPIVVVGATGQGPRTVPVVAPDAFTSTASTTASLDATGNIRGDTLMTATGPAVLTLRQQARQVQSVGPGAAVGRQLQALGQTGRGNYVFLPPDGFGSSYEVHANFTLEPQPEILDGDAFAPALGPILLARPGDLLLGPANPPTLGDKQPTPCLAGRQVEELSLRLPDDRKPLRLPADRRITTEAFTYISHWAFDDQTVTVRRELVSRIGEPLCHGALRLETAAALREIHRDQQARIVLDVP
jgi:transglutaminase-like putative cysteine protease